MRLPELKPHDKIALVCPGSVCTQSQHPAITQHFMSDRYKLESVFSDETTQKKSASERAAIFLNYLFDDQIKLIAALRGGEGTSDILPYIHQHYEKIKKLQPKPLLGLSDFTALLVYFNKYYQWPVIHGPSPLQFALERVDDMSQLLTMNLLFGKSETDSDLGLSELLPLNDRARENHAIEAELTGGNLSLMDISIKDIWEIETKDKIIFIEDVAEKAHKIIRTLKYFSRIHLFDDVKAVIFGDFTCDPIGCRKEEQEQNHQAILKTLSSFAKHHSFPVLYTKQFGHGKTNFPLIYSTPYCLQLGEKPQLTLV